MNNMSPRIERLFAPSSVVVGSSFRLIASAVDGAVTYC